MPGRLEAFRSGLRALMGRFKAICLSATGDCAASVVGNALRGTWAVCLVLHPAKWSPTKANQQFTKLIHLF
jgi:hypothetical protein